MKNDQNGFSVTEALIAIVAVGLIGCSAYLVNSRQNDETTATENAVSQVDAIDNADEEQSSTADWKTYEIKDVASFKYPPNWILIDDYDDRSVVLRSEEPIDDETVNDRPLSKNIYFDVNIGPSQAQQAVFSDSNTTEFEDVEINGGLESSLYKRLTSADELNASEFYFLADSDLNRIKINEGYLNVSALFNAGQSDYEVITPLKKDGSFVADERQEVKDFVEIVKSLRF